MKSFRHPSIFLYVTVLGVLITMTSAMEANSTAEPVQKEHKGLKREEKAAIWAAFFGLMVGFVGFGFYVHGFYVRRFSENYDYLNRTDAPSVHDQKTLPVRDQHPAEVETPVDTLAPKKEWDSMWAS